MKHKVLLRLVMLSLFMAFCVGSSAQEDYEPFIKTGKTWYCMDEEDENIIFCYMVSGDTVINNTKYAKILFRNCTPKVSEWEFFAAMREDVENRKVYYLKSQFENERLMYNFNLEEDGSYFYEEKCGWEYYDSKWVVVKNINRRFYEYVWFYVDENDERSSIIGLDFFIEGIGFQYNPIDIDTWPNSFCRFVACFENDECVADANNFYPSRENTERINKVLGFIQTGINNINSDAPENDSARSIYSLDGRRLQQVPEKGVYIVNGRKMVRK